MTTLCLVPRRRSRSRSRGRGGRPGPTGNGGWCGKGGPPGQRFLGTGTLRAWPQFQQGGPVTSITHAAQPHSGRCRPGSLRCLCSQARSWRLLRLSLLLWLTILEAVNGTVWLWTIQGFTSHRLHFRCTSHPHCRNWRHQEVLYPFLCPAGELMRH